MLLSLPLWQTPQEARGLILQRPRHRFRPSQGLTFACNGGSLKLIRDAAE